MHAYSWSTHRMTIMTARSNNARCSDTRNVSSSQDLVHTAVHTHVHTQPQLKLASGRNLLVTLCYSNPVPWLHADVQGQLFVGFGDHNLGTRAVVQQSDAVNGRRKHREGGHSRVSMYKTCHHPWQLLTHHGRVDMTSPQANHQQPRTCQTGSRWRPQRHSTATTRDLSNDQHSGLYIQRTECIHCHPVGDSRTPSAVELGPVRQRFRPNRGVPPKPQVVHTGHERIRREGTGVGQHAVGANQQEIGCQRDVERV